MTIISRSVAVHLLLGMSKCDVTTNEVGRNPCYNHYVICMKRQTQCISPITLGVLVFEKQICKNFGLELTAIVETWFSYFYSSIHHGISHQLKYTAIYLYKAFTEEQVCHCCQANQGHKK